MIYCQYNSVPTHHHIILSSLSPLRKCATGLTLCKIVNNITAYSILKAFAKKLQVCYSNTALNPVLMLYKFQFSFSCCASVFLSLLRMHCFSDSAFQMFVKPQSLLNVQSVVCACPSDQDWKLWIDLCYSQFWFEGKAQTIVWTSRKLWFVTAPKRKWNFPMHKRHGLALCLNQAFQTVALSVCFLKSGVA